MRCVPAIFHNGHVDFPFSCPDYPGPVAILIMFPGPGEDGEITEQSLSAPSNEEDELDTWPRSP